MISDGFRILKTLLQLRSQKNDRQFSSVGYCPSCMGWNVFIYSRTLEADLQKVMTPWEASRQFKGSLLERENHLCARCFASFRMRAHARSVLKVLGLSSTRGLAEKLQSNQTFHIFETSALSNIFRFEGVRKLQNYVLSEYFDLTPVGGYVSGIRNENLECLTFQDQSFDLVINSDVLEHVADLDKALSEIRRVLKPGGHHVFTVPGDNGMEKTRVRAALVHGEIRHFTEPEMHSDPIRQTGSLAFRNFGADVLEYVSRDGLVCKKYDFFVHGRLVTSVYYATKTEGSQSDCG
jgi:SAM-dependent methyltransferase